MADAAEAQTEIGGWMEAHGDELHAHLCRMLGSRDAAEDVLQEVWVIAHRSPPPAAPERDVRAWLYRVATREALDTLALRGRRNEALEARSGEVEPTRPPAPDAFLEGLGPDGRERVRRELARLPRKQRDAVWLRWGLGWGYGRIAGHLECSRDSARVNVYHGLTRLRQRLSELWKEVDGR